MKESELVDDEVEDMTQCCFASRWVLAPECQAYETTLLNSDALQLDGRYRSESARVLLKPIRPRTMGVYFVCRKQRPDALIVCLKIKNAH